MCVCVCVCVRMCVCVYVCLYFLFKLLSSMVHTQLSQVTAPTYMQPHTCYEILDRGSACAMKVELERFSKGVVLKTCVLLTAKAGL